jgi:hypothetical protein
MVTPSALYPYGRSPPPYLPRLGCLELGGLLALNRVLDFIAGDRTELPGD